MSDFRSLQIDILVNNGGRSQRSLFEDTGLDVYQGLMDLNYMGTVSITKHVLPHMIATKKGKIITISSITGLVGVPLSTGYAASKHALQVNVLPIIYSVNCLHKLLHIIQTNI